jgi:GNAT superfamily N-acetyltransferase
MAPVRCIVQQAFDTEVFGVPYHRIVTWDRDGLSAELPALLQMRPVIIDAKVPASASEASRFLQGFGFRLVCVQTALRHDLSSSPTAALPIEIHDRLSLSDEVVRRHVENFVTDRFSLDAQIGREPRDRLFDRWIRNSLSGAMKASCYGLNFCSFKIVGDTGVVDLLSVLEKGRGIGKALVASVLEHARQTRLRDVTVVTECGNDAAWRLYQGCGFGVTGFTSCFHYVSA